MKRILFAVALLTVFWGGLVSAENAPQTTVTYTQTTDQFANPERGFYRYLQVNSSAPYVWFTPELTGYRTNDDVTLIYCLFLLDTFKETAISPSFLTTIQDNLNSARDAGLKCILRFAYTYEDTPDNDNDGLFDPPYGDVDKPLILQHLTQLTSIIQANSDMIAVWQAGFIGIYGEWYYTDHFLDVPKQPDQVSATQWARRYEVLDALLTALPNDRMTQVRYPNAKRQMLPTTAIMPSSEAYSGSNRARIGFHNDCFLAPFENYGTFVLPDDRAFMAAETQFLPMGGESCIVNTPESLCPNAVSELQTFHFSYLNSQYHLDVLTSWESGGCMTEIKRELGYRLALQQGEYQDAVAPDNTLAVQIELQNDGFAAPFNPRDVELILRGSGGTFKAKLNVDPRTWYVESGVITLDETLLVPNCIPAGNYALLLNLPDPEATLNARPEYAIRLANQNVWEAATGYNDLGHTVTVSPGATPTGSTGTGSFGNASCTPLAVEQLDIAPVSTNTRTPYLIAAVLLTLTLAAVLVYNRRKNIL